MDTDDHAAPLLQWRRATIDDLDAIMAIQEDVHSLLPEPKEIVAEKMRLFGEGCRVLVRDQTCVGYGVAHPWRLDNAPALGAFLGQLPENPTCLFIHDVAILPTGRAGGAGRAFIAAMTAIARHEGIETLALVSVYGTVGIWEKCGFRTKCVESLTEKLVSYGETAKYMVMRLD